jgi:hypothetical protein
LLSEDRDYSVKKLGLTAQEFAAIMAAPCKTFLDYRTSDRMFELAKRLLKPRAGSKQGYLG